MKTGRSQVFSKRLLAFFSFFAFSFLVGYAAQFIGLDTKYKSLEGPVVGERVVVYFWAAYRRDLGFEFE